MLNKPFPKIKLSWLINYCFKLNAIYIWVRSILFYFQKYKLIIEFKNKSTFTIKIYNI